MAINNNAAALQQQFKLNIPGQASAPAQGDRPKANFWLNIGYSLVVAGKNAQGEATQEHKFVSLPVGIPLDTTEALSVNSRNAEFAQFQAARNLLMTQILDVAKTLKPGEEKIIGGQTGGLEIQLRRVNDEVAAPAAEGNPFAIKLTF